MKAEIGDRIVEDRRVQRPAFAPGQHPGRRARRSAARDYATAATGSAKMMRAPPSGRASAQIADLKDCRCKI